MVLIFLLSIFSVAQFTLSTVLSNRESAIDTLNRQLADIASQLSLEKRSAEDLQKDVGATDPAHRASSRPSASG